jgi:2-polyprenyl-6-methoxyphenol hydroxylase-like FAD-dependent oxidoreductase
VNYTEVSDVIIVGAGPVGLALAIELGSRGVNCLIVERNDRVGYAPRAKTTNVRTRTHLRRWGIADQLAAASPFGVDYPSNVVFTTRLSGTELARFADAFNTAPARNPLYPEHAQWIPQYKLEEVLRSHVATLSTVKLRFNVEFESFTQDDEHAEAHFRNVADSKSFSCRARYLVGADGTRSKVRELIGATMSGRQGLSYNYNIIFRAPGLMQAHRHGPAIFYWQINADAPSALGPMDRDDVWFIGLVGLARDTRLSEEQARAYIVRATGIDLPYEILSSDQWAASRLIATKYRERRAFLAGDACHLHPPYGGYGMNMGIGDGADLGWKLAAVLQGWGGERLLESYEEERKPVHEWIMDEAEANHAVLGKELFQAGIEDEGEVGDSVRCEVRKNILATKKREFHTIGAVLGYCYQRSPVIMSEDAEVKVDAGRYEPSSRPGCLAPHLWLADGSSLYDSFGSGFTLLARRLDRAEEAVRQAHEDGYPLKIAKLPEEESLVLYPRELTLVRPDQHVCWRGDIWDTSVLRMVSGNLTVASSSSHPLAPPVNAVM